MRVGASRADLSPARTGVWIGVAASAMIFAALTSALMVRKGAAADWRHIALPPILYFNTVILVASSATAALARRRLLATWIVAADSRPGTVPAGTGLTWLYVTLGLGVLFVAGQLAAWRELAAQGVFLASNPSSSFFYVFTALHGLHLVGGVIALGYLIWRVRTAGDDPPEQALGAATLYWHFLDVLWLYLLLVLILRL